MSDLWLALALVGTFLTIFLAGVLVDMMLRERNRPMALLQTAAGPGMADPVDLRQDQLEGSILERMLLPGAGRIGRRVFRMTPLDLHGRIGRKLVLAGNPPGLDAERIVAFKVLGAIGGTIGGIMLTAVMSLGSPLSIILIAGLGFAGYVLPSLQVGIAATARQREIQRTLPDVMDLLTISVEAGLGFDAALSQVTKNVPGPLAEELSRLLQEVQIGVGRADAFRHLGERTSVPELQSFVLSMIQADLFGVSIANVLRAQSRELRQKRRQRAEEIAQKIPVKLLFPMIFLVMPAMFIVLIGPGVIKIMQTFFD
ncbi:MAG TPA: type II secretion system F family protein [Actinomycetota bacterium]|nr:type II secretion system F family protein [Actinomycetota bacterium]